MAEASPKYRELDVSSWAIAAEEPGGTEEKYWLEEPDTGVRWLLKPNNVHIDNNGEEWSQREDLSEKVAAEVGVLLGVPCAKVELAVREGRAGCLSRDLKPEGWELHSGQVLLSGLVPDYLPGSVLTNKERKGHSLENISAALRGYRQPPGALLPDDFDAFDTFVGYLVLDALIANRDRHDENWAVMRTVLDSAEAALAGSFDHARAFGSSLPDDAARVKVMQQGIERWAARGTAWRFEHSKSSGPCTLVELAARGLSMVSTKVQSHWLERAQAVDEAALVQVTARVPRMSQVARTFFEQVYAVNRRRVLDEC